MEHSPDIFNEPPHFTDPLKVELSDEKVREFQQLLKEERGLDVSLEEARAIAVRMIRLYRLLLDPDGHEAAVRQLEPMHFPDPPPPKSEPRPCPIRRDADHAAELERSLAMLYDELRTVRRRPNNWRWAVVALYDALGHALALHCPPERWPVEGLGQLTRMFDVVVATWPELKPAREAVETVDRIRTNWLRVRVAEWPVGASALVATLSTCQRYIFVQD